MLDRPIDWPAPGPIDLATHDLPHASSTTEWWYVNSHLEAAGGRRFALFASFFRIVSGVDEATKRREHAHSLTWALVDLDRGEYVADSVTLAADGHGPAKGLVVVGHYPSGESGQVLLSEWLSELLPGVPVTLVRAGDPYLRA